NGNDTITVNSSRDAFVSGDAGDDTITVTAVGVANVDGGAGDDKITVTTVGTATSVIDTGLGNDHVDLHVAVNGGADTITFGDINYTALQAVDTASTTQNFTQKGILDG